uniref:Uncharacterized protein n=1 Tax=uncultured marine group II/III euryarchaeote KM3_71_E02 TaxID=1456494 RepID=A0A075HP73_9EURY|nr:hypothetical protein [uncultured marine group II/III euryarchaeote KM3_71_E02]
MPHLQFANHAIAAMNARIPGATTLVSVLETGFGSTRWSCPVSSLDITEFSILLYDSENSLWCRATKISRYKPTSTVLPPVTSRNAPSNAISGDMLDPMNNCVKPAKKKSTESALAIVKTESQGGN